MTAPLEVLKSRFGDDRKKAKAELIKAVQTAGKDLWTDRLNEAKGLEHVSNKKLLHLEEALQEIKSAVGSRDRLVGELLQLENREKDGDYKVRLDGQSTLRLWDVYKAAKRRVARAEKKKSA